MKKQMIVFILLSMLLFAFGGFAQENIKLYVNNSMITCDVPPIIVNDRTLVPARALFEPLGAALSWNDEIKQAKINLKNNEIKLNINSNTAYVNDMAFTLDTPPLIMNSRTMMPVRFIAENLGFLVEWDAGSRAVLINQPAPTPSPEPTPTPEPYSNVIKRISNKLTEGFLVVSIEFTKPLIKYELYPMDNPSRIVLELNDCTYNDGKTVDISYGGVQKIRMANHTASYRIVTDLDEYLPHEFILSEDKTSAMLQYSLISNVPPVTIGNTVVLDAGHGGSDSGALGYRDGEILLKEKDINLDIANQVASILREKGVNVLQTRSTDVAMPLSGRYDFANNSNADLFVSIHNNSFTNPDINGTLTLYSNDKDCAYPNRKSSKEIAKIIQDKLVSALNTRDCGIRSEDELAVIKNTKMPAVLVEVIFVSSAIDQDFIMKPENRTKAAVAIAEGILTVLEK